MFSRKISKERYITEVPTLKRHGETSEKLTILDIYYIANIFLEIGNLKGNKIRISSMNLGRGGGGTILDIFILKGIFLLYGAKCF